MKLIKKLLDAFAVTTLSLAGSLIWIGWLSLAIAMPTAWLRWLLFLIPVAAFALALIWL